MRLGIGAAFAVAPARLSRRPEAQGSEILMTRSFAVREVTLGVGGLLAARPGAGSPSSVRMWAAMGVLTDAGDLAAALAGKRQGASTGVPALVATCGLLAELWALHAV